MLKIGINWLSPYTLPTVRRLLDEGVADFCEIMVDNAVHLSTEKIRTALPGVPLALHIVSSHFLTKSADELQNMAAHLRPWIAALKPLYVSDHLPQLDYQHDFEKTMERVCKWQKLLNVTLLLENFSSMSVAGVGQASFYARLIQETQCGLLFDFSNAYIAECNGAEPSESWKALAAKSTYFHVAGFRIDPKTQLATDTHDGAISDDVMRMMQAHFAHRPVRDCAIVFELDEKLDYNLAKEQITRLRAALSEASIDAVGDVAAIEGDSAAPKVFVENRQDSKTKKKLISAVTEWSLRGLDHIAARGIIMRSKEAPDLAVGLWKSTEPDQPAKIVTLDISAAKLSPANAYAISYQQDSWAGVEWVELS